LPGGCKVGLNVTCQRIPRGKINGCKNVVRIRFRARRLLCILREELLNRPAYSQALAGKERFQRRIDVIGCRLALWSEVGRVNQ
jgi:hypothetical protein